VCALDAFCCDTEWDAACVQSLLDSCGFAQCGTCNNPLGTEECGSGQRCKPTPNGVGVCTGPVGSGTQRSPCDQTSDCAAGFLCVETANELGECLRLCDSDRLIDNCPGLADCVPLDPAIAAGGRHYGVCD